MNIDEIIELIEDIALYKDSEVIYVNPDTLRAALNAKFPKVDNKETKFPIIKSNDT